jgi:serine O-acetyltransferase
MLRHLREDLTVARERDPAARGTLEILLCYPGVHALCGYRIGNWLWRHELPLAGRICSALTRWATGVDIRPAATLGPGLFIDHATGVVIGETAEVGANVTLYHGVTLGGTSLRRGKRHPTISDGVTIGAGAKVLGPITIGEGSRIGANAVVVRPVPPNSVVVGVPGQIISRSRPRSSITPPDLNHTALPDVLGASLDNLLARVARLERTADLQALNTGSPHPPKDGVWHGEDFSI